QSCGDPMSARSAMPAWVTDPRALSLLAGSGRPFDQDGYRRAYRDTYPEADDCSFGAVMPDGTQAAMALMGRAGSVNDGLVAGRVAESVPFGFGGVVSTRLLSDLETAAFLDAARQASTSRVLLARSLPIIEGRVIESPGTHIGWASVVRFVGGQTPAGLFAS